MRKLPMIVFAAAAAFSMNTFAVSLDTSSAVDVDATVDVVAPSVLSASWTKVPALQAGTLPEATKIGSMEVSGLGDNTGWVIYTDGSNSQLTYGYTTYIFKNADGSSLRARVHDVKYPGVQYGAGTGVGTGPIAFIPAQYNSVDFVLTQAQTIGAGTYSATLSVAAYNN